MAIANDVVGDVVCPWLADFRDATSVGDDARAQRAEAAVRSVLDTPVMAEVNRDPNGNGSLDDDLRLFARFMREGYLPPGAGSQGLCLGT